MAIPSVTQILGPVMMVTVVQLMNRVVLEKEIVMLMEIVLEVSIVEKIIVDPDLKLGPIAVLIQVLFTDFLFLMFSLIKYWL